MDKNALIISWINLKIDFSLLLYTRHLNSIDIYIIREVIGFPYATAFKEGNYALWQVCLSIQVVIHSSAIHLCLYNVYRFPAYHILCHSDRHGLNPLCFQKVKILRATQPFALIER